MTANIPSSRWVSATAIIGEAMALKWGDIDFRGRFVKVRRSIVRGRITTPKSHKERRVDMTPQLAETLKAHRNAMRKIGLNLGLGDHPEFVFVSSHGKPLDKNSWRRRVFYKALKKAELRQVRIHGETVTQRNTTCFQLRNIASSEKLIYRIEKCLDWRCRETRMASQCCWAYQTWL